MTMQSLAQRLAALPAHRREQILNALGDDAAAQLMSDWAFWARPKQLPPPGDWSVWVLRTGRAWGKTICGSWWVQRRAMEQPRRWIAIVARTPADARDVAVEGPSGILRNAPRDARPHFEPSKRRLTWPNGSWGTIYSDEEPDQLRGFSGDSAWVDEFAKFQNPTETWDNLAFGMREASSDRPRTLITTTPRPITILTRIEAMPTTIVVTGSSWENRDNLDPSWFASVIAPYVGTRLGRQELEAEILSDAPGALWTRALLERAHMPNIGPIEGVRLSDTREGPQVSTVGCWAG
jgi:phage terminase large subunit-like protein